MSILVTGASGFVGTALIEKLLEKGHKVYGLSRHPPMGSKNLIPVEGDITEANLGMGKVPKDIHTVHHVAGIHSLGEDKDGSIWQTNVEGTRNVLAFCIKNNIPRLYFTSTAYTWTVNTYGRSKIQNEIDVKDYAEKYGLKVSVLKPSVIMPAPGYNYPGHFLQFAKLVLKLHHGAEVTRRMLEEKMRLPLLRPVFRIPGNPDGWLNLIMVSDVAQAMADIDNEGTFWLTNGNPPKLKDLVDWVSEVILVDMRIEPESFKATPIEATFQKIGAAFLPYLQGDSFESSIKATPITKEYIQETVRKSLLKA